MVELARTVRLCIDLQADREARISTSRDNTFAGWPSMSRLGAYYEFVIGCRDQADPVTGYAASISAIDQAVRDHALRIVGAAVVSRALTHPSHLLGQLLEALGEAIGPSLAWARWNLTPYYSLTMHSAHPDRVAIRQQFEFSAAHRLHNPALSEAENASVFGKCNNPSGHGHNYRVEPVISVPLTGSQPALLLPQIERIVNQSVISRFDHKFLNLDVPEFAVVNPSVENITRVCYELLYQAFAEAGAELQCVTVWETEKTRCTYPAPAP